MEAVAENIAPEDVMLSVAELLAAYEQPTMAPEQERELRQMMTSLAQAAGMDQLPALNG